jgi:NTP pyrophosphatase (non-canonical NTP hydrolase)
LELDEYQNKAYGTSVYKKHNEGISALTYTVLALCGESGELANKLKKHLRAGTVPDAVILADELGDVLWYASAIATELGTTLEDVAQMNLAKLKTRREGRLKVG